MYLTSDDVIGNDASRDIDLHFKAHISNAHIWKTVTVLQWSCTIANAVLRDRDLTF